MKIVYILFFHCLFFVLCAGENLIKNGDFNLYPNTAGAEYSPISAPDRSRFELFTEDLSWNKCGMLKILSYTISEQNDKTASASVLIGSDGKDAGFPCKPDTAYRYSLQVRGTAGRVFVRGVEWRKDNTSLWSFAECKKSRMDFPVGAEWSTIRGVFKTGPEAVRAALDVSIWWSSRYEKDPYVLKEGDYLLFDNVKIEEVQSILPVDAAERLPVETVKSAELVLVPSGQKVSAAESSWENVQPVRDFLVFSGESVQKSPAEVSFQAQSDGENLYLLCKCEDPEGVTSDPAVDLWRNDVFELFFRDPSGAEDFIQIAVGACGRIYTDSSRKRAVPGVTAEVKIDGNRWQAFLTIPVKIVYPEGLPSNGSRLGFNVALKRTKAEGYLSWNKVKTLRTVSQYGVLVVGGYGEGISRAAYEKKVAEAAAEEREKKFAAFRESKTAVGVLSVTSDYSIPMSAGLIDPVKEIRLKVAVNEIRALPIAVANLDSKATEFRVTLEAGDQNVFNGSYGLKGYPAEKIVTRVAVRTRDGAGCTGELFDPLPRINEASTLLVPAGECGVVWIDFDTAGVKPGIYSGVLRVTPLNKKGRFPGKGGGYHKRNYQGTRVEIPVSVEIQNIELDSKSSVPSQFFAGSVEENEKLFAAGLELGAAGYSVSPWFLGFPLQEDGTFIPEAPAALERIRALHKLADKYEIPFRFLICYSVYNTFLKLYRLKDDSDKALKLWPEWIRTLKKFMDINQIQPDQFVAELFDEPGDFQKVIRVVSAAHEAWPELRIMLTLDSRQGKTGGNYEYRMRASVMRQMEDAVDTWVLHRNYYFTDPEHLKFYKEIQAKGKKVGHYTCEVNPSSQLHGNYRLSAWFSECYNLDSTELYQLVQGIGYNGGVDFASATDGNLLLVAGYGGNVIPTIRSMAFRQGVMDVKYLAKLREIGKDSPEAQAFLETAAKRVAADSIHDQTMPDRVREEAAALILKLQAQREKEK